jgi:WD40 repeat protein/serine/threonine protein kinase
MNRDAPTPDERQLYSQLRQYDEAIAQGAKPTSLDVSNSAPNHAAAEEFERLCQCVTMLERVRRSRDSRVAQSSSHNGRYAAALPVDLPLRIGRFELRGEIGRGGCGVVFRAHDSKLGRDVAIKIPRPEALVSADIRQRFLREARAAGNMDHPNLVAIHEVGEDGAICYIAAAYIDGPTLAVWLRRQATTIDARKAVALIAALAGALEHTHARGVIHRDIKPGNILLQSPEPAREASDLSSYIPKLTDFGLAKLRESTDADTRTGTVIGTIEYMAPEQAEGRLRDIDAHTDIYALGAILYELLTGRPPLRGETYVDTLRRIVTDDPPLVRLARPGVSRDVEAICHKCLEKNPSQRYGSASELAADCRRFLDGQATVARPIGPLRRLGRWSRRRPAFAALLLVSTVSLTVFVTGALIYNARLADALSTAEFESSTSRQLLYSAEVRLAFDAWGSLNRTRTLELLSHHIPAVGQPDLREFAWHWLWGQCHSEVRSFVGHTDEVFSVAFSPDGKTLATASKDGTARTWDVATGNPRHTLAGHTAEVICVAFSPDGTRLVTGSEDRQLIIWDSNTGESLFTLAGHEDHILAVAFSPDGRQLASGGRDDCVRLWDLETRLPLRVLDDPLQHVRSIRYSPDGRVLAACDEAGLIHRWDTETWKPFPPLAVADGSLFAIDFHPDSRRLLAAGRDTTLYYWDLDRRKHVGLSALDDHESWIRDAKIAPNGKTAATCNHNGFLRLWDIGTSADQRALLAAIPGHAGRVWSLDWSPDGKLLATGGADRVVKLWNVTDYVEKSPYEDLDGWVWNVAFTADSTTLVTSSRGGAIRTWNVDARRIVNSHDGDKDWGRTSLAITSDGKYAATASSAGASVRYLDLTTGDVLFTEEGFIDSVLALDISHDGTLLAVGSEDSIATILELPTGKRLHVLPHDSGVDAVAFSPDGGTLATSSRELRLWNARTGAKLWGRRYHEARPRYATFSPDGRTIAVAVGGDNISLVDASTGELRGSLLSDQGSAACLAFSPDGNTLAVGIEAPSADPPSVVVLWDVRTQQQLCELDAGMKSLFALTFSPNGKRLVAAGQALGPQRVPQGTGRIVEWVLRDQRKNERRQTVRRGKMAAR